MADERTALVGSLSYVSDLTARENPRQVTEFPRDRAPAIVE